MGSKCCARCKWFEKSGQDIHGGWFGWCMSAMRNGVKLQREWDACEHYEAIEVQQITLTGEFE